MSSVAVHQEKTTCTWQNSEVYVTWLSSAPVSMNGQERKNYKIREGLCVATDMRHTIPKMYTKMP